MLVQFSPRQPGQSALFRVLRVACLLTAYQMLLSKAAVPFVVTTPRRSTSAAACVSSFPHEWHRPQSATGHTSWAFGGMCALASFGIATFTCAHRLRPRQLRLRLNARSLVIELANTVPLTLPGVSVSSMDAFMHQKAAEVLIAGSVETEDKPGEPGVKICYVAPTDFGPFRTQLRVTMKVQPQPPGKCIMKIIDVTSGSVNKSTGEVTWPDPKEVAEKFAFESQYVISWRSDESGNLFIKNHVTSWSKTELPFWIPIPDAILHMLVSGWIKRVTSSGQEEVMSKLGGEFAKWKSTQD
eukprot:TRINITY_DN48634_c0_g1_i1.p1 TRINITY_DN48634_c0_g1~~TRINITY_DN48634_c0_g1_i1.p1  ORF type:complete len:298 (+),score=32.32 TRINITY_DN48634_c0_g1_i1:47-940(+)